MSPQPNNLKSSTRKSLDSNTTTRRDLGNLLQFNGIASRVVNPQRHSERVRRARTNEQQQSHSTICPSNTLSQKREKKEAALLKLKGLFSSISILQPKDSHIKENIQRKTFKPGEVTIPEHNVVNILSVDRIEIPVDREVSNEETDKRDIWNRRIKTSHYRESPNNVTMFGSTNVQSLENIKLRVHDNFVIYNVEIH